MPRIASAKKRAVQSEKRHLINVARKTAIKTAIKKTLAAIESNDIESAKMLLKDVQAKLARAKSKDTIHANAAARKLSRLAKKVAAATTKTVSAK